MKGTKESMKKRANRPCEGSLDKCQIGVRLDLETKYKILKKYGGEGVSAAEAVIAALEECSKGVVLTRKDKALIESDKKENYRKRMAARAGHVTRPFGYKDYSQYN